MIPFPFLYPCITDMADDSDWASDILRTTSHINGGRFAPPPPLTSIPFDLLYMMQQHQRPPNMPNAVPGGRVPSGDGQQVPPGYPFRHPLHPFPNPFIRMDHAAAAAAAAQMIPAFLPSMPSVSMSSPWPPHMRFLPPLLPPATVVPTTSQGVVPVPAASPATTSGSSSSLHSSPKVESSTTSSSAVPLTVPKCSSIENLRLRAKQHAASIGLNMC